MESVFKTENSECKIAPHSECPGGGCREKRRMRLGTWNVRTLGHEGGKLENVIEEMRRCNLDIVGLSEVGWQGEGEVKSGGFCLVYSGGSAKGLNGVGVAFSDHVSSAVVKVNCVNDRVIMVRMRGRQKDLVIIQVCMPTSQCSEEVDDMYDNVEEVIKEEKRGACVILMGDWNAVVGEGQHKNIVGKYGLGERNERGNKLIEFCERNDLIIGNTMFEHHKRRRYTWTNPLNAERYQIDYIMIQKRFRNHMKNAKTMPGAVIDSDHKLLVSEIGFKLKKTRRAAYRKKWDVEKSKERKVCGELDNYLNREINNKQLKG